MIENKNVSVTAETPEFKAMLAHAQSLIDAYYAANGYDVAHKPVITATEGPRYFRVMKLEGPAEKPISNSVYVFIDKSNGDILKAAGWKAPVKGARGNIFSGSLDCLTHHGVVYLR